VLPKHFAVSIDAHSFEIPPVFGWIAAQSNADAEEMLKTFNCGIGLVLIVPNDDKYWEMLIKHGAARIGKLFSLAT
jgi:phosphoribosylaminoimidazole (AIR) synthetase